jgi:hypothetical protein
MVQCVSVLSYLPVLPYKSWGKDPNLCINEQVLENQCYYVTEVRTNRLNYQSYVRENQITLLTNYWRYDFVAVSH